MKVKQLTPDFIRAGWLSLIFITPCLADDAIYQQKHLTNCGQHYFGQAMPQSLSNKNHDTLYYLCFDGFAVGYSSKGKIALWSAEHLTKERLLQAETLERQDNFHEESQLPTQFKASLQDYKKAPFDRGHLAPNADMATLEQQYDSFSLANIVPQNPHHNRGIWRSIETRTRYLALTHNEVYVITGTAFLGEHLQKLNNNLLVPTHLYKVIYIPAINQAGVYFSPNNASGLVEVISLNELALRIGYDIMPNVEISVQNQAFPLPIENLSLTETQDVQPQNKTADNIIEFLIKLSLTLFKWFNNLLKSG